MTAPLAHADDGANSLSAGNEGKENFDVTLYGGMRLWRGAELWLNPEVDQGFGLSNTHGVAGFPNGEIGAGNADPYIRLQDAFIRQTINLGGATNKVEADINQMPGRNSTDRLVVTAGKFSVTDIFDNNHYAHDPRNDFLNFAIIDMGSFDYASDAWGYTEGASLEGYWSRFAARAGFFVMSKVPGSEMLETNFSEFQIPVELEEDHTFMGNPGKLRALFFLTHAQMASYDEATQIAIATVTTPDLADIRSTHTKMGGGLNLEQQLTDTLGAFARVGYTQGSLEAYDFTDINETASFGLSLNGKNWNRPKDTVGLGFAVNNISNQGKEFLAAGGMGILVGDGQLSDAAAEQIIETYYSFSVTDYAKLSADYQFIDNPAYNTQRGPVSVFGVRGHIQF